jgi:mono/diheme cytochrome c family protein
VIFGQKQAFLTVLIVLFIAVFSARALAATTADATAGAILFRDKGCAFCHGAGGVGTLKAPSLVDIRKNKLWPPEKMKHQIMNGGQKMPPFGEALTDQEIVELIEYLRAKHRPAPPPAAVATPAPAQ